MSGVETLCGHGLSLLCGESAQGRIGAFVFVFLHLIFGGHLNFIEIAPLVL